MEQVQPQSLELTIDAAAGPRLAGARLQAFDLWFLAALLVHGALLLGLVSAKPRQLGDAAGVDGAISVSLVSESDLRGEATVDDHAAGEPVPAAPVPQQPPATPPPQAEPLSRTPPEPQTEAAPTPAEAPAPAPQAEPPPPQRDEAQTPAPPQADAAAPSPEAPPVDANEPPLALPAPDATDAPFQPSDLQKEPLHPAKPRTSAAEAKAATPPEAKPAATKPPEPKKVDHKPAPTKQWDTKTAKLDLSVPPPSMDAPSGSRGAGIERPAGITRSGENDRFARGVIRALQQTMPQLRDTRGRVRVRITLDRNGNLVKTDVLMPSQIAGLDQSVVFATRQTSFPLPPNNATPADLVFVITYIYR